MNEPISPAPDRRPLAKGSACEGCKARKVRCSAEKPACMNCLKHARRCVYPVSKTFRYDPLVADAASSTSAVVTPAYTASPRHEHPRYSPYPHLHAPPQPIQSFQPFVGGESDQQAPAHWEDLDFSWLLDLPVENEHRSEEFDSAMQEHCFFLYFTNQRASGLEMNIGRFYERIAGNAGERPHPALLNAMYLITCEASPIDFVRQRASIFFADAEAALNDAISDISTLAANVMDLLRAAILLTQWLWGQAREGEAIIMTAKACRLAMGAGYDQITSSNTLEQRRPPPLIRARRPMGPPPRDYVELAERIYAFWSVVMLNLTATIASGLPAHIDPVTIRTPLPRAWADYTEEPKPDYFLADLFAPADLSTPQWTDFACIIQSTVLLHLAALKTMSLVDGPRETFTVVPTPSPSEPSPASVPSPISPTSPSSDRVGTLHAAVERFVSQLPDHLKSMDVNGGDRQTFSPQSATMHFMVCATRMYLVDTNSFEEPNDAALYHVRRIVDLIRLLVPEEIACLSLFVYVVWVLAGQLLIREVKRLRLQGESFAAMALEADLTYLGGVLGDIGKQSRLVTTEVRDLHAIIDLPMQEMFRAGMRMRQR